MACSKYTLTNTGSTIVNFSYRRCDDSFFDYQVELLPNQVKNIWVINGTYTVASSFRNSILFVDEGPFPPISATNTPTPSNSPTPTPSVTASQTPTNTTTPTSTPTVTNTQTITPTNTGTLPSTPTPTPNNVFAVYSGSTSDESCGQYYSTVVLYGNNSQFDLSSQFSNISSFPPSVGMTGFIQNSGFVFELDVDGFVVGSGTLCSTLTPTPTNSSTPTVTPTNTSSPTPTFGYYTYSLGTGATANDACVDFSGSPNTIYGTVSGGAGPNAGEFLYTTPGNPPTNVVPNGYYSNGTAVFEVTGGLGQITSVDPSGC